MADGNVTAIELKGITRNRTKIGVEDGQAEDLINLRFVDGSWRTSGNGRQIQNFTMGQTYSQLYIHTNGYRHLLGVYNGTLYWFADIATDGVTFTALNEPVPLTTVYGDIWITQTGHLLTVIDEHDDFEHLIFKTGTEEYSVIKVDVNGQPSDRSLFPFGQAHFNYMTDESSNYKHTVTDSSQYVVNDASDIHHQNSPACVPKTDEATTKAAAQIWHAQMLQAFNKALEANQFTAPFLAIVAVKLYDGSYAYASQPALIIPRQKIFYDTYEYGNIHNAIEYDPLESPYYETLFPVHGVGADGLLHDIYYEDTLPFVTRKNYLYPVYTSGASSVTISFAATYLGKNFMQSVVRGADLLLSIEDIQTILTNRDVFTGIGIFITAQSYQYRMAADQYKNGVVYFASLNHSSDGTVSSWVSYKPPIRRMDERVYDLMHSPFYLLRDYNASELEELQSGVKVDLSGVEYKYVLKNLTAQKTLSYEAMVRNTYLPKVSYMYNNRLHIANYLAYSFFGYPIDFFQLHNHSLKVQDGLWYKGVLRNLEDNHDEDFQYETTENDFISSIPEGLEYFAYIQVVIETTTAGEQKVVRYIAPYDHSTAVNGRADFIESLNPLLTYPDSRAKKMKIVLYKGTYGNRLVYQKEFDLKPHPYLNLAYHIDPDLAPIAFSISDMRFDRSLEVPTIENAEESFPNCLKVSKTNNPMFFPVENAYQVGSSEILALCSNAIAVGTGQTGAAPLYVFCADGIYALFVDSSGQMAYTNARVIARDVVNNRRSVTPTDQGVVFTTDRGIMSIAGEQVQEIGSPAEGDVLQFWNNTKVDFMADMKGALRFVAAYPELICDTTDFLTYLKDGAIVNYNHNEHELIISNPTKVLDANETSVHKYPYSYVMDRDGNWSRRDFTADEYVNNYPTSYRLSNGVFYKVDEEGNDSTPLDERKEADNKFFYVSREIKLGSIGFKCAHRFVVRGYFETTNNGANAVGCYIYGSYDGRKYSRLGRNERKGKFTNIGCLVERTDMRFFRICLAGQVTGKTRIDYMEISSQPSVLNTKIR